jgi:hypothetical protein
VPGNGEVSLAFPAVERPASDRLMERRPPHLRIDIGWRGDNPARPSEIGAASPLDRATVG